MVVDKSEELYLLIIIDALLILFYFSSSSRQNTTECFSVVLRVEHEPRPLFIFRHIMHF